VKFFIFIEYGDVSAYRLSLSEDTKALNQLVCGCGRPLFFFFFFLFMNVISLVWWGFFMVFTVRCKLHFI
jgi:hypothetical protein